MFPFCIGTGVGSAGVRPAFSADGSAPFGRLSRRTVGRGAVLPKAQITLLGGGGGAPPPPPPSRALPKALTPAYLPTYLRRSLLRVCGAMPRYCARIFRGTTRESLVRGRCRRLSVLKSQKFFSRSSAGDSVRSE